MERGCVTWDGSAWTHQEDKSWRDPGFPQTDQHPVVCISWSAAKAYTVWLSRMSSKSYRLLSEAEREYATRAGTTNPFWWGAAIGTAQANYDGNSAFGKGAKGENRKGTVPADRFAANAWGLYNVHGNVYDRTEDCWHDSYNGAPPADGSPWRADCKDDGRRVIRGGFWGSIPQFLRSANRDRLTIDLQSNGVGFRVGRALTP
jgi:formylglycine-generating enzyme required for sulfatase activity